MASTSKGKTIARDWRYRVSYEKEVPFPSVEELKQLKLPFELRSEQLKQIPLEYSAAASFLVAGTPVQINGPVSPWTGWSVYYNRALHAVANTYGVWFEIRRRDDTWEAFQLARQDFLLKNWPVEGIDLTQLELSGEPIPKPSRANTPAPSSHHSEQVAREVPIYFGKLSSQTPRQFSERRKPRKGRGEEPSDDESSDQEDDDERKRRHNKSKRLERVVPAKFNGDRGKTEEFLHEFKRYVRINNDADIMCNPTKKCNFFLSLMEGKDTRGFVYQMGDWLDEVNDDPDILPYNRNAWQVLEAENKKAFVDYAEEEKANEELRRLRMKDENVDAYIAQFRQLAHRGKQRLDEPETQRMFAMGLPGQLRDNCNLINDPRTFDEWAQAAQRNHRIWLRQKSMKPEPSGPKKPNPFTKFAWQNNKNNQNSTPKKTGGLPRQFNQRDPNAMDTSAGAVRKAVTEEEKKKHREEGQCYSCSQQGHLSRNCPLKKAKARTTTSTDAPTNESSTGENPPTYDSLDKGNTLAEYVLKLTDEERDIFIRKVAGEDFSDV